MALFDFPYSDKKPVVLSASRMTDMPAFYPDDIIREVEERKAKDYLLHTIVLWTKHPDSLFHSPLYEYLEKLKQESTQIYLQLTISGLGNKNIGKTLSGEELKVEQNVSDYKKSILLLPKIIELVKSPERILLRIDPIIRIKDVEGNIFSNIDKFEKIVKASAAFGVSNFTFSFLENGVHSKVDKRFESKGMEIISPDDIEREKTKVWIKKLEKKYKVSISACCVKGFSESSCINGKMLVNLHNEKWMLNTKQPKKRDACGCTESIDIGGWPPKKCKSGCLYCYANPQFDDFVI